MGFPRWYAALAPLFDVGESSPRHPDQLGYLSPASDGFRGIMTVSECIRMARATLADIEQRAKFSTKDCKQLSNRELEREAIWQTLLQQAQ